MAVSLIKSPIGHKLSTSPLTAGVTDDGGDALFTTGFSHALTDGDYVYVISNFDSYNGFKYVDSVSYTTFKLRESEGDYVPFKQVADVTYYVSVLQHGFQCVHLPIVYELKSNIWPNNIAEEAYVPITIVSQSEVGGYTVLQLSAAVPGPRFDLEYIELVGSNDLAGPYQVIEFINPWEIKINLDYDAGNSFTGLQVVNYYNNYAILVRIYAGLLPSHPWASVKPIELAATLKLIPDANGRVKFSISEYLRSYIDLRNRLTLDTLPNNTDFLCEFYIQYAESYDQSDGTDITTFTSSFTEDDFIGRAINAKLPFKTISEGHLSEYVNEDVFYAKWLTLQTRPVIVIGRFFDLSFLNQLEGSDIVITKNGVDYLTLSNPGVGVLRVPIEAVTGDVELCIIAYSGDDNLDLSEFTNQGSDDEWTLGENPSITTPNVSDILFDDYAFVIGQSYTVTAVVNVSALATGTLRLRIYSDAFATQFTDSASPLTAGYITLSITFTATANTTKIGISRSSGIGSPTLTVQSIIVAGTRQQITEEICMDVVEECEGTFVQDDNIRLTEDGDFRILE